MCVPLTSPGLVPGEISSPNLLTETKQRFAEEAKREMAGIVFSMTAEPYKKIADPEILWPG